MSENKTDSIVTAPESTVTMEMIFQIISKLQNQLHNPENSPSAFVKSITPALEKFCSQGDDASMTEYIRELNTAFVLRESSYQNMMKLYSKMLDVFLEKERAKSD